MMRIEKILIKNYRQFRNLEIILKKEKHNDIHIFIGRNGQGKTNILNSINWCLYGDEPHLSKDSEHLPLLNLNTIEGSIDKIASAIVEVWAVTNDNKRFIFSRKANFKINKDKSIHLIKIDFEVKVIDSKGNTKPLFSDDATSYVERFVPNSIREFFFFDGERLDNYFKGATGSNIRHEVFLISQIDLLDRIIEKLENINKELTKELGKSNPEIDTIQIEIDSKKEELTEVKNNLSECENQIDLATEKIRELNFKINKAPNIEKIQKELAEIKKEKDKANVQLNTKLSEKRELLFEYGIGIRLYPKVKSVLLEIDEKKRKKELPPTYDKLLLNNILKSKKCNICGQTIDKDSEEYIHKLVDEITISSKVANELVSMDGILSEYKLYIEQFLKSLNRVNSDIGYINSNIEETNLRKEKLETQLLGFDNQEQIKNWYTELKVTEEAKDNNNVTKGRLIELKTTLSTQLRDLGSQMKDAISKEKRYNTLSKQIKFTTKSIDNAKIVKETIMSDIKDKIESETRESFFKLIWKHNTFSDVTFDDQYNVNLIHKAGYSCLGSVSAAERELFALSFTLALHKIAGFDSPILIDTPVAKVSDEHRVNFSKIFLEVSKNKQIILLFTPSEYSEDVSSILDTIVNKKYRIMMMPDERESYVEIDS